jgi:hypothetical protein
MVLRRAGRYTERAKDVLLEALEAGATMDSAYLQVLEKADGLDAGMPSAGGSEEATPVPKRGFVAHFVGWLRRLLGLGR